MRPFKSFQIFPQAPPPEKKRKETLLSSELGKYLDKKVRVKFQGGREGVFVRANVHYFTHNVVNDVIMTSQPPVS